MKIKCPSCGEEIEVDFDNIPFLKFEIRCKKCGTFIMLRNPVKEKKDDKRRT